MGAQIDWTAHVLALAPELSLLVLVVAALAYDRILQPAERRRVGLLTAWGGFATLLITLGVWLIFDEPNLQASLS